jgi:hypothetical protein
MTDDTSSTPSTPEIPEDPMRHHIENIKFMKALYGHCKAYVECHPEDSGAFQVGDKWLTELDLRPGADWQVRRTKLAIMDWFHEQRITGGFIETFKEWLFGQKFSTNE